MGIILSGDRSVNLSNLPTSYIFGIHIFSIFNYLVQELKDLTGKIF